MFATPSPPDPLRTELIEAADAFVELPLDLAAARQSIADCALDVPSIRISACRR
ncbi:MAG: hypothetical protein WDO24_04065 [Pseudomonadota bacterium]